VVNTCVEKKIDVCAVRKRRAHPRATNDEFGAALDALSRAVAFMATPKSRGRAGRIAEEVSGATIDIEKQRAKKPPPKIKAIEEFSAASGISRATVSKYFNDPDNFRPATRERIEIALNPIPEWPIVVKD
jgi:hypothetical protein